MERITNRTITAPDLLAKLAAANGQIIFRAASGDPVKTVETIPTEKRPPGMKSPFTVEQVEEGRIQPDGLPLAKVWKRIRERYGS